MQIDRLFVVYDPTTDTQHALDRAAIIAGHEGSGVHLYACIHGDTAPDGLEDEQQAIDAQQGILEKAAQALRDQGIEVSTEVEWEKDWYQAMINAVERNDARAVLKSSHPHSRGERRFKRSSDWTLIRECDCPVLLVKTPASREPRKVLAAIDIGSGDQNHGQLNDTILKFCQRYIGLDGAEVFFINGHKDLATRPDRGTLIRTCGVDPDRVFIEMGDPDKVIVDKAVDLGVNLVVIGNSARSGLSALVKGNTAEKVLDQLDCDLLALA